ncbi:MAG: SH3 domain-containing protein [Candidatus Aminicenantes bacterium]|nr:SH3 domain-containing protein [Candidatus Aminicenantes bacterium]
MIKKSFNLLTSFCIAVTLLSVSYGKSQTIKIEVIVNTAIIRLKPSDNSLIVAEVHLGTVLEYQEEKDGWIRVNLPPNEKGYVLSGYIHKNQVEKIDLAKESPEKIPFSEEKIDKSTISAEKREKIKTSDYTMFSIGLGYGIPYGILGMNCEFNTIFPTEEKVFDYIAVTGGFGYFTGGVKYVFGLRVYPLGRKQDWQPRLSAYYGTTGFYKTYGGTAKNYSGPAFGAGILWMSRHKISVDLELQYRFITAPSGYIKEEGVVITLSAGVQYHF